MSDAPYEATSPAPGARAAKLCGVWSIVASVTCVGIPIGIVLAILALVKQAKANRQAKEHPDLYERPAATGLVTGIIGLAMPVVMVPFIGIVSAIAIPAMLNHRARAEGQCMVQTVKLHLDVMKELMDLHLDSDPSLQQGPDSVISALIKREQSKVPQPKNPYDGSFPYERAQHPSRPGNVSLWAEGDPVTGSVILVRYTVRAHGKDQESSIPMTIR